MIVWPHNIQYSICYEQGIVLWLHKGSSGTNLQIRKNSSKRKIIREGYNIYSHERSYRMIFFLEWICQIAVYDGEDQKISCLCGMDTNVRCVYHANK